MPTLEIREATGDDFVFAWQLYVENAAPCIPHWSESKERSRFGDTWKTRDNGIVSVDADRIGWFACVASKSRLSIEHLYLTKGNRGIPTMILDLLVNRAALNNQKVWLSCLKKDPSFKFLSSEGFPSTEGSDERVSVDISDAFSHSHKKWVKSQLPWEEKWRTSHV